jgi:hypothetical protein
MEVTPRVGTAALLVTLLIAAAGCGSDDPDLGGESSSAAAETPTTGSTDPSASPSPSVQPAAGVVVKLGAASLHAPEGWAKGTGYGKLSASADSPDQAQFLSIGQFAAVSSKGKSLLQQAQIVIDQGSEFTGKPKVEPIATIGGEPAFHLSGTSKGGPEEDMYGLVYDDIAYSFRFMNYPERAGKAGSGPAWDETIESVLASAEWR